MPATHARIDAATKMGPVHYSVSDLGRMTAFYQEVLGFSLLDRSGQTASLGAGGRELLRLTRLAGARRARGTTGLYHTAFLVPTRRDLAHLVLRIAETRTPVHGTSNHGTHLAIYLPDPEGNGIELAWDFPRDVWPMKNGMYDIASAPREGVDIDDLLTEIERNGAEWTGLPAGTTVGHVHLHVADLESSEQFYHGILGFDVTLKSYDFGALFVSAGGYHHHIGGNIWRGVGIPKPPEDALGLRTFSVLLPSGDELERVLGRLSAAGIECKQESDGYLVRDPSGIGLVLAVASEG